MKKHLLHICTFVMLAGMMLTLGSCTKDNYSKELLGTWRAYYTCQGEHESSEMYFDITFNKDGVGYINTSMDWLLKSATEPFYYIFNEVENTVTFIQVNHNDAPGYIFMFFQYCCEGKGYNASKAIAITYAVQINNGKLVLTDRVNGWTIPFTRQ